MLGVFFIAAPVFEGEALIQLLRRLGYKSTLEEGRKRMQAYADFLDELREKAKEKG